MMSQKKSLEELHQAAYNSIDKFDNYNYEPLTEFIIAGYPFGGEKYDNIGEAIRKEISSLKEDLETITPLNYTLGELRFSTSDNKTFTFTFPKNFFFIG